MSTIDSEQQRHQRLRSFIVLLLALVCIVGFLGAFVVSGFVSDSFPSSELTQQINPAWIAGVGVLISLTLCVSLWLIRPRSTSNVKTPPASKILIGLLIMCVLIGVELYVATYTVERIIARSSAKTDAFYLTSAGRWFGPGRSGCTGGLGATWQDPFIHDAAFFCPTFPLFQRDDGRTMREAIVHVRHGAYGIRILTIHALDTQLGQEDISIMRASRLAQPTAQ